MPAQQTARKNDAAARDIEITRVLDAPRELVWKAWTDPKHLAQWFGPHGSSNSVCEIDLREGGRLRIDNGAPDGKVYSNVGVFQEIVPPEKLVFTLGLEGLFEVLSTITLKESGGKTTLTLNARVLSTHGDVTYYLERFEEGWNQTLDRLGEVATATADREIFASRIYNAPRELVFSMWTDPNHIVKWWGPRGFNTTIQEMDVRPGGKWLFVMHGPDPRNYDNKITYREIVKPERIVYDHISTPPFHVTVTFAPYGENQTRVSMHMLFDSVASRDNTVKVFNAAQGLQQTLVRLDEELQKMRPFIISRTFDASRDLMWKVWTESDRLARWFGPKGARVIKSDNDLRPGGVYHYALQMPDGSVIWGKWVYREIAKPERLLFVQSFSDEKRGVTRHPMAPNWPLEMLSTITFTENAGKTTVTVEWRALNATDEERATFDSSHASMTGGWSGTFERLEAYLPKSSS